MQGLSLLSVTSANTPVIGALPYSEAAVQDITNKGHADLTVKVPERPVTWGKYRASEGYVVSSSLPQGDR